MAANEGNVEDEFRLLRAEGVDRGLYQFLKLIVLAASDGYLARSQYGSSGLAMSADVFQSMAALPHARRAFLLHPRFSWASSA